MTNTDAAALLHTDVTDPIFAALSIVVERATPNGSPAHDGAPRYDPASGRGLITQDCIRRKVRNAIQVYSYMLENMEEDELLGIRNDILLQANNYVSDGCNSVEARLVAGGVELEGSVEEIRDAIRKMFVDTRLFGYLLAFRGKKETASDGKEKKKDGVSIGVAGAVSFTWGVSNKRIRIVHQQISRSHNAMDSGDRRGSETMGWRSYVDSAVYTTFATVSPARCAQSGCRRADVEALFRILPLMFCDHDISATRPGGSIAVRDIRVWDLGKLKAEKRIRPGAIIQPFRLREALVADDKGVFELVDKGFPEPDIVDTGWGDLTMPV